MEENLCKYGCGKKALFQLKSGGWICSKSPNSCLINKEKNKIKIIQAHLDGRLPGFKKLWSDGKIKSWNKGKTKLTDERIREGARKNSLKTKGRIGKPHSPETKAKLSLIASKRNNGNNGNHGHVKTKYYEIFSPYQNKNIKVQGSWEYKYALYLNENKIDWIRSKIKNLKYKLHDDDYTHTYFPDFFLPKTNEFIEIKGFMWKSKDGRVDDKRKMQKVIEQNPDKKILVLMKEELKKLNIKL